MTPAFLIALAAIQQVSPEEAIAAQRTELRAQIRIDCPPGGEEEDIVVCGRGRGAGGSEGYRIPYVPEAGRIERLPGEAPTGRDALAADRCLRLCPQPVMINVVGAIRAVERGLERILHPD
ncbi:MAG TPA: hypothetical protein VJS15_10685 [Allosphingosinicella sp.]|nr:hypothetical protein [Allosphingosinicella sp.]